MSIFKRSTLRLDQPDALMNETPPRDQVGTAARRLTWGGTGLASRLTRFMLETNVSANKCGPQTSV